MDNYAPNAAKSGRRSDSFALAWREESGRVVRLDLWEGGTWIEVKDVRFSIEGGWLPRAVSDAASRVCVLGRSGGRYEVTCPQIGLWRAGGTERRSPSPRLKPDVMLFERNLAPCDEECEREAREEANEHLRAEWERGLRPVLPQFVPYEIARARVESLLE